MPINMLFCKSSYCPDVIDYSHGRQADILQPLYGDENVLDVENTSQRLVVWSEGVGDNILLVYYNRTSVQ